MTAKAGESRQVHESVGVLHIHTNYSDGTGTTEQIAGYAAEHGLQWLIITDHEHLEALDKGEEGYHGPVLVLVGSELGDEHGPNHYLAYGIDQVPPQDDPARYVAAVQEMGGFGAIAHPHEKRDAFEDMPPYPWTAWDAPIDGVEIWNQLSQWTEGLMPDNRLRHFVHPLKSLTRPDPQTLAVWDRLNLQRPVVGYVGVDAHSIRYPVLKGLFHVKVFHYKVQFRSLRTHLMLPEPLSPDDETAKAQVLTALRSGRHFGANHRVGDATGARFFARVNGGKHWPLRTLATDDEIEFVVRTPLKATIRLLCDGELVAMEEGRGLNHVAKNQPGVWRAEVHRHGKGWIYFNPFRVLPKPQKANRNA